jgi:hypothetical protein
MHVEERRHLPRMSIVEQPQRKRRVLGKARVLTMRSL